MVKGQASQHPFRDITRRALVIYTAPIQAATFTTPANCTCAAQAAWCRPSTCQAGAQQCSSRGHSQAPPRYCRELLTSLHPPCKQSQESGISLRLMYCTPLIAEAASHHPLPPAMTSRLPTALAACMLLRHATHNCAACMCPHALALLLPGPNASSSTKASHLGLAPKLSMSSCRSLGSSTDSSQGMPFSNSEASCRAGQPRGKLNKWQSSSTRWYRVSSVVSVLTYAGSSEHASYQCLGSGLHPAHIPGASNSSAGLLFAQ